MSDSPIIRRPKKYLAISQLYDVGDTAADICIPSFEVKVDNGYLIRPGVRIYLRQRGEAWVITIGAEEIGELNKRFSRMISLCSMMGVKYNGELITKANKVYARFYRVSQ